MTDRVVRVLHCQDPLVNMEVVLGSRTNFVCSQYRAVAIATLPLDNDGAELPSKESLRNAFKLTQNRDDVSWKDALFVNCLTEWAPRSTAVGDIFHDVGTNTYYLVDPEGFSPLVLGVDNDGMAYFIKPQQPVSFVSLSQAIACENCQQV